MRADQSEQLFAIHSITQVLLRYCTAVDTRQPELMAECFTADARLDFAFMASYTPTEYIALCNQVLPQLDSTQHMIGPPLIDLSNDSARSRTYFQAQHVNNRLSPQPCLLIGGWYDDQLVRVDGAWKIRQRQGVTLWVDGNPAVLGDSFPVGAPARSPLMAAPQWLGTRT